MANLEQLLEQHFGYSTFRPGQKEVIEAIIEKRDVVALLPTGMGKSLCYQLPGYVFNRPVLIISPLLSLMQDQVEQLKRFGEKRVIALNSFLQMSEKRNVLQHLGQYRFIFTSPEMLKNSQVQAAFRQAQFALVVVDEAHCISQWGFDFRPDYLKITDWMDAVNRPPILALSATATEAVVKDIKAYLHMSQPFEYIHSVDRVNLHYDVVQLEKPIEKAPWILAHVLKTHGPGIVYTQSRKKTAIYTERLLSNGIRAAAYHAGMEAEDRQFIQQQFLAGQLEWICATNAFGMGVHKDNVRQIIHDHIPSTVANYMQEVGRAGRDGQDALSILLYVQKDEDMTKFIITEDIPQERHVEQYLEYTGREENPAVMLDMHQISETGFRVLSYWMQRLAPQEVQQKLVDIRLSKVSQVDEMKTMVTAQKCIREQLLHYFGQSLNEKPNQCCHYCGIEYGVILKEREHLETLGYMPSWGERLSVLLPNI
ncbi:ATP-dependent DNA helicase RecQ [Viridibacillus sp. YIM B01967]|uniref:ATP-dependent DNA helicase RecQ n=1 Tax=Viridibacillus soli TaxID=2798301 RepID=A0ABS1HCT3_9BACL|nr:RecQ family ATP-dependent DNA helicase [Viridibacillus soli]MBK3497255.1 ATP-dependent DNA helicase RecQ [Viridibacillus soli]